MKLGPDPRYVDWLKCVKCNVEIHPINKWCPMCKGQLVKQ